MNFQAMVKTGVGEFRQPGVNSRYSGFSSLNEVPEKTGKRGISMVILEL
jgi:hypothetical protein